MNLVSFGSSVFSMYKVETIPPSGMLIDGHILWFGRTKTFSNFVLRLDIMDIEDSLGNAGGEKDDTFGEKPTRQLIGSTKESMFLILDVLEPIILTLADCAISRKARYLLPHDVNSLDHSVAAKVSGFDMLVQLLPKMVSIIPQRLGTSANLMTILPHAFLMASHPTMGIFSLADARTNVRYSITKYVLLMTVLHIPVRCQLLCKRLGFGDLSVTLDSAAKFDQK